MAEEAAKKMAQMGVSDGSSKSGGKKGQEVPPQPLELDPPPSYIQSRIELFDKLKAEYDAMVAGMNATLPQIESYYELCPVINRQN